MNAYSAPAESPGYRCTYSKPSRVVTPFVTAIIIGLTTTAHADQGDILARFRLVSLEPVAQSTGILNAIGTGVNNTLAPEVDFTYMATNHIGIELILGSPRVSVTSNLGELGRVSLLPPTLTAAWHFNPNGLINPYVGAGINYTLLYNSNLSAGGQKLEITRHSFGPAFQAGVDIRLTARTFFNLDVKKIYTHTDATLGGASLGTLKVNPWLFGVGVGMRF